MTIKVSGTTVIPYPEMELKELKELLKRNGMAITITENTKVSRPTINSIVDTGLGQRQKVDKLRAFVKEFNKQYPVQRA